MSPSNTAYTPHRTFIKFINCKEKKKPQKSLIFQCHHIFVGIFFPFFYFLSSSHWICLGLFFYYIQLPCYFNPKIKRQVPQTDLQMTISYGKYSKIFECWWLDLATISSILKTSYDFREKYLNFSFVWYLFDKKKPINCRHQTFVIKSTGKEIKKIKPKQLVIQYTCNTHGMKKKSLLFLFHLQMHHLGIYDATNGEKERYG